MCKKFFSQKVVNVWNALPSNAVSVVSANPFKTLFEWTDNAAPEVKKGNFWLHR
jgi:hypothetical protein